MYSLSVVTKKLAIRFNELSYDIDIALAESGSLLASFDKTLLISEEPVELYRAMIRLRSIRAYLTILKHYTAIKDQLEELLKKAL